MLEIPLGRSGAHVDGYERLRAVGIAARESSLPERCNYPSPRVNLVKRRDFQIVSAQANERLGVALGRVPDDEHTTLAAKRFDHAFDRRVVRKSQVFANTHDAIGRAPKD